MYVIEVIITEIIAVLAIIIVIVTTLNSRTLYLIFFE